MAQASFTLCRVPHGERMYWYALFRDPKTGKRTNKKSVEVLKKRLGDYSPAPVTRRSEAEAICVQALEQDMVFRKKDALRSTKELGAYLSHFFDWETSPYIQRRLLLDPQGISKDYMHTRKNLVDTHVVPLLEKGALLSDVSLRQLEDLQFRLVKETSLSKGTVNMAMQAVVMALKEAQQNGYAERNPEADIEGYDACRKIAILSSLAYGAHVDYRDIYTEGITKITATDIKYAQSLGASIKLLATSKKVHDGFYAMVSPVMINAHNPLYSVQGVFNAIFIHGNVLGDAMFYGSGAGKLPTASAVVADVVDCAKHLHKHIIMNWSSRPLKLMDIENVRNRFFVRMEGCMAQEIVRVNSVFGDVESFSVPGISGEFAFITEKMPEHEFREGITQLKGIRSTIRVGF